MNLDKEDEEIDNMLGKLSLVAITIATTFSVPFLKAYIILSIASWYSISFITNLTYWQIYGSLLALLALRASSDKKPKADKAKTIRSTFKEILWGILGLLIIWGFAWIVKSILL